jgi:hypothetical protein
MTDQEQPEPDGDEPEMIGDPIPDVFPPDLPDARFVVAMGMARNDIERALRDLKRAVDHDAPDFTYRVRLVTGHLVEAIDSLKLYRDKFEPVRKLLARVSPEGQKQLSTVSGTLQRAGKGALEEVRINTFHYPSPDPNHGRSSDEKLRDVLALMTDRGVSFHVDGDTFATTMSFADDAALDLAMGRTANLSAEEALRRSEIARDGAFAFHSWFDRLIEAYIKSRKLNIGDPVWSDKPKPEQDA